MERLLDSCREVKTVLKNTNISWWTYGLISCFSLSSWITVNGIWSELPVLVVYAPEKWRLASYVVVIIQLGNIGPLLFSLANRLRPHFFTEKLTIYVLILIGILSCLLLSLFWKRTSTINGTQHSTALMVLVLTLALVDCTSTIVFLSFMSLYDPRYLTALYIGETLCGLIPGLTSIAQGSVQTNHCNATSDSHHSNNSASGSSDGNLLFGADTYFAVLLAMMIVSGSAFLGLNFFPFAKREQRNELFKSTITNLPSERLPDFINSDGLLVDNTPVPEVFPRSSRISGKHIVLFCMQAIVCSFSFGVIPTLSPYVFEPYGSVVYHLVASLGPISVTVMCFFIIWLKKKSFTFILAGFVLYMGCAIYLVLLACQSPTPWLYNSHLGTIIAVLIGVMNSLVSTYIRLSISMIMKEHSKRALYWCGVSIQIGSCLGAFSMFPFVNILHEFHTGKMC